MKPNRSVGVISLVGFVCSEVTIVIWVIIGGIMSSDVWLVFVFLAKEGKIVMVVLSTVLFCN